MRGMRHAREIVRENGDLASAAAAGDLARLVPASLLTLALDAARADGNGSQPVAIGLGAVALDLPHEVRQRALNDVLAMSDRLVARQAILRHAMARWGPRLSVDQVTMLRSCLDGVGLDDCTSAVAAAADLIRRVGGTDALTAALATITAIRRWWPQAETVVDGSAQAW
jgi:hypothetical protein